MKASDLMKMLEADPEYQEMRKRKDLELKEREALLAADERGLIEELAEAGYEIESVWDFVNSNNRYEFLRKFEGGYRSAYSILVKHLNIDHHRRIREGIIRALTEKDANETASEALLAAFYQEQDSNLKWVLANALRTVLTRSQKAKHPEYKEIYNAKGQP
jgi:predicted Zn-dependent protease